ncbi:MAG: hypothetical protein GY771_15080 [bacterium]|nr:hypothetical protein [bacterium]
MADLNPKLCERLIDGLDERNLANAYLLNMENEIDAFAPDYELHEPSK